VSVEPRAPAPAGDTPVDVILISTTDLEADRAEVRTRMLESVAASRRSMPQSRVTLSLLVQRSTPERWARLAPTLPGFVSAAPIARRIPLSAARNCQLRPLIASGEISPDALVAFPDDDCWYPGGFLSALTELFEREPTLDFWFCRYGSHPLSETPRSSGVGVSRLVRNASSNTLFLRGRVVTAIGEFDEGLGVGTPMGGAEDLDYALRAYRASRRTGYHAAALVGHRDKSADVVARYFASGLAVLARHARHGAWLPFIRKVAVGFYLILRRRLTPRELHAAMRRAMSELRAS
jgi:hypothetical protein